MQSTNSNYVYTYQSFFFKQNNELIRFLYSYKECVLNLNKK